MGIVEFVKIMYIVILIVLFSQIFANNAFLTKTNKLNMEKLSVFRFILIMSLVFNVNFLLAQNSISGTIVDTEDGVAIPGASVFILGTTNGSATDFDGNHPRYAWRCPDDAHVRGYSPDRPVCARYRPRRQSSRR